MDDDGYDAAADMERSILECYRAIRARVAAGGPPWVPPKYEDTCKGEANAQESEDDTGVSAMRGSRMGRSGAYRLSGVQKGRETRMDMSSMLR